MNTTQDRDEGHRPSIEQTMMDIAQVLSRRSTCARRNVGCVLVDHKNRIIGSGYNGVPRGVTHCKLKPCAGAKSQSGTDLTLCEALHAEQNALLQCADVDDIETAYCTTFPCMHCLKMLANTNCSIIIYQDDYSSKKQGENFWIKSRRGRNILPITYYDFTHSLL